MNINVPRILNVVALILLLAGAFSPGCIVYEYTGRSAIGILFQGGSGTVYRGLFYTVNSGVIASLDPLQLIPFLEFQIEVIIVLITCFLATIFTFTYKAGQSRLLLPIILNLISGIFTGIAVVRFFLGVNQTVDVAALYIDKSVPYSFILIGLGGILCFITVIILFVKKQQDSNLAAPGSSLGVVYTNAGQPQINLGCGMQQESQKTG